MLVVYDKTTGVINNCLVEPQWAFDDISARYKEMGISSVVYDGDARDIMALYVKDGVPTKKPVVSLSGENRPVKADGVDTLKFTSTPAVANVLVIYQDKIVHQESITDGVIEFSVDHAGTYRIQVGAEFPWMGTEIKIEAIE